MTARRKAANPVFSRPPKENLKIRTPKFSGHGIKCSICGEGGGTLVKISDGVYRHSTCH
jgi:hypothetical protein